MQLLSYVSPSSLHIGEDALETFSNVALHLQEKGHANGLSDEHVMQDLTQRVCALEDAAAGAWETALIRVTPQQYRAYITDALAFHAFPRLALSVVAAVLHGLDPRHDEFAAAVILAYSSGEPLNRLQCLALACVR
jgi:hypothetical protein